MRKLVNYWHRWCLCYREYGLEYTVRKTFRRIDERRERLKNERNPQNDAKPNGVSNPHNDVALEPNKLGLREDKINIGFLLRGGMGDIVIAANFLYKFRQRYNDEIVRLDVFADNPVSTKVVIYEGGLIDNLYNRKGNENNFRSYDVFFDLARYPDLKRRNDKKIRELMPELLEYIYLSERFRAENARFFHAKICDGQSAAISIIQGKKRIQQPDIYGFFGITEKFEYDIPIMEDWEEFLGDFGLSGKRFVTINRGVDTRDAKDSIKMWSLDYCHEFARLFKEKYPDILLIQLGASSDRCPAIKNVDINLVGKTNLEQVKVLLKHAALHVDNEGGMVHMRHAINGGASVVMFGPTSADFYGYSENENLVGKGCDTWCEWIGQNWQNRCTRNDAKGMIAPCMLSLTPEMVMEAAERVLGKEGAV